MKNERFFAPGAKYRCIKTVGKRFVKGKVYELTREPSMFFGWLRNEQGEHHAWPQIENIERECQVWPDLTPEKIDPRLYFERV